jgi:RNAse (barnase) inhibitor barstar
MKDTHFFIAPKASNISQLFPEAFIASIDGQKSSSLRAFLEDIGVAMHFPEYYGQNLDALDEMLNDLEWIDSKQVVIYITHSGEWLRKEKSEQKMLSILDVLDATAEDWKWLDEEDNIKPKELRVVFEESGRIVNLLADQQIPYTVLS